MVCNIPFSRESHVQFKNIKKKLVRHVRKMPKVTNRSKNWNVCGSGGHNENDPQLLSQSTYARYVDIFEISMKFPFI